jgi:hypothetical protein
MVSNGTLDLDKINARNDNRLQKFKGLGVESINTNSDEDMNRLNTLLSGYH